MDCVKLGSPLVVAKARCPPPVEHLERVLPRPMGKQKTLSWSRHRVLAIFAWVQGEAASLSLGLELVLINELFCFSAK